MSEVYSLKEVAQLLKRHPMTIRRWYDNGEIKGRLKGHTLIFFQDDVDAYLEKFPQDRRMTGLVDGQDKHIVAVKMSEEGKPLKEIAETLGYKDTSGAVKAIHYGRKKLAKAKQKLSRTRT